MVIGSKPINDCFSSFNKMSIMSIFVFLLWGNKDIVMANDTILSRGCYVGDF